MSKKFIQLLDKYDGRKYFGIDKFAKYSWISINHYLNNIGVQNTIEYEVINETSEPCDRYMMNQYVYRFM